MGLTFVNVRGEPVSIDPQGKLKAARRPAKDVYHKGWRVVGISPQQQANARAAHATSPDRNKPFDMAAFLRAAKPVPVRSKPYELFTAALACAEMAAKAGWIGAHAVEVAKGGR